MTRYFNTLTEAKAYARLLKKEEPEYKTDIQISETCNESFGIWAKEDLGKYVVTNETE